MISASDKLAAIHRQLAPLRAELLAHPVYAHIESMPALHRFMEHHVFAVWDFMSLLKALQQRLCCVQVPWIPSENAAYCRMINEIVLGEESDLDSAGNPASHFELYLRAMEQCGANTSAIQRFLELLRDGTPLESALGSNTVPEAARRFVRHTFKLIQTGDAAVMASAFTFGREDLLPDLFRQIVETLDRRTGGELQEFRYYLDRHIEVDDGEHGPAAERLIMQLCGTDPARWDRVEQAARESLLARKELWGGVMASLRPLEAVRA